jgi:DNA ligase (NAD+)
MSLPESKLYIENLRKQIEQHNYNYYVLDNPTVSDFEFDRMLEEHISLEKKHTQLY